MTSRRTPGPIGLSPQSAPLTPGTFGLANSFAPGSVGQTASGAGTAKQPASCAFVRPTTKHLVAAPDSAFVRRRGLSGAVTLSAVTSLPSYTWPHGPATAALSQDITISGHTIASIRPLDAVYSGLNLPSFSQIVDFLKVLPKKNRTHTHTLIVSPVPHPSSGQQQGETIAQGGADDIIIFPASKVRSANFYDNLLVHESGHNYQSSVWKSGAMVAQWTADIAADGNRPSAYSASNSGEDFSEFYILYITTLGTACAQTLQSTYPARYARMSGY